VLLCRRRGGAIDLLLDRVGFEKSVSGPLGCAEAVHRYGR
jgi:hypothetical protein